MFGDEELALLGGQRANGYSPFDTYRAHYDDVPGASPLARSLYVDVKTWLVDDILTKVDRASMACSLESRVPLLSSSFVEYAFRLPPRLKIKGLEQKYILKQAMRRHLPREITHRKKRGFNAPVSIWMRDCWKAEIDDLMRSNTSTLVDLQSPLIQRLWREHSGENQDHGFKLWTLLSLILWERQVYRK
jgi:asparagine synthase (glutamine-hydrolysing)